MSLAHIMLAMANKPLLSAYCKGLACNGFEVTTATDGLWCMSLLRGFTPDVLVIDPALPWGGGDGVVAWMKEERALALVTVVALPSQGSSLLLSPPSFRADLYLERPPSIEAMARILRQLLHERGSHARETSKADEYETAYGVAPTDRELPRQSVVAARQDIAL